jgi:hypothetical protein
MPHNLFLPVNKITVLVGVAVPSFWVTGKITRWRKGWDRTLLVGYRVVMVCSLLVSRP